MTEKVENFKDYAREVWRMWALLKSCTSGCWGIQRVPLRLKSNLKHLGSNALIIIALIQKSALLSSARIVRKELEMWRRDYFDWFSSATCCFLAAMTMTRFIINELCDGFHDNIDNDDNNNNDNNINNLVSQNSMKQ